MMRVIQIRADGARKSNPRLLSARALNRALLARQLLLSRKRRRRSWPLKKEAIEPKS